MSDDDRRILFGDPDAPAVRGILNPPRSTYSADVANLPDDRPDRQAGGARNAPRPVLMFVPDVKYLGMQEFGSVNPPKPRPFLRAAFDAVLRTKSEESEAHAMPDRRVPV